VEGRHNEVALLRASGQLDSQQKELLLRVRLPILSMVVQRRLREVEPGNSLLHLSRVPVNGESEWIDAN